MQNGKTFSSSVTLYRGAEGMWSWVAQRITGLAIFFFLLVHILDTALVRVSPEAYNAVIGTYKNPVMGLGEVGLVAGIIFHAMNGLRVVLIDYFPRVQKHQKLLFWLVILIWAILMAGFLPVHLRNVFSEHH